MTAACVSAIATIVAAVIGLAGQAISQRGTDSTSTTAERNRTATTPAKRCVAMVREVRQLPRSDPELAAELARGDPATLPSLWSVDEIAQCGGVEPETLLEGTLAPNKQP